MINLLFLAMLVFIALIILFSVISIAAITLDSRRKKRHYGLQRPRFKVRPVLYEDFERLNGTRNSYEVARKDGDTTEYDVFNVYEIGDKFKLDGHIWERVL